MGAFETVMKMCDDCDRTDLPLEWSRDGNTKICEPCRIKRGAREQGPATKEQADSAALEALVRAAGGRLS